MDKIQGHIITETARKFLDRQNHRMLVDGQWVESLSGQVLEVVNPADEQIIGYVPSGNAADIDLAVRAASRAFESGAWSKIIPQERERLLLKLADLIEKNAQTLAELESIDNGKSAVIAKVIDVSVAVSCLRYMAGWATKIEGSTLDISVPYIPGGEFHAYTRREPVGVVGAIVPWNFPLLLTCWKLGPALATGCTVVLKPAEQTPLSTIFLGELIMEAGYPAGVVNIVTGDGLSAGAANAIFFNHGQVCCAGSRVYVQKKNFDKVVAGIADVACKLKIGPGLDPTTELGPLVSREQMDRVCSYIEIGRQEGAEIITGGDRAGDKGFFVQPTVLVGVSQAMRVVQEEIFGPVVVVMPYDDLDQVAAWANDTPYGLGASIWSNDLSRVHRLIPKIRAGTVWVNCHSVLDPAVPFGGFKQSGLGREMGKAVLESYLETKSVVIAL